jgi:hypothetical protein
MKKSLKRTVALGTPVAGLILLIVAVMLSTITAYVAINIVNSRVQGREQLFLTKCNLWYKNSSFSIGGLVVVNIGATDIVLNKITVHGEECFWNGTSTYILYNKTTGALSGELPYVETFNRTGTTTISIGEGNYTFQGAGDDFILPSGWTMAFYVVNPGKLQIYNVGREVEVVVSTSQAVWCTESNVKAAPS